jgi:nitrite reductase (NO-forming)
MKKKTRNLWLVLGMMGLAAVMLISSCGNRGDAGATNDDKTQMSTTADDMASHAVQAHRKLNQKPVPVKKERTGQHEVHIRLTAQVTDIRVDKGTEYKAWTFNGQAPGPLLVVREGDLIHLSLTNKDPAMSHSMDMHAIEGAPSKHFTDVSPGQTVTFTYRADRPGVYMYHCGTAPVLQHVANGMHGMIIVKPKAGYPTDRDVDREYVIIQNEWYKTNDYQDMLNGMPKDVVFSTKALKSGDPNTNGDTFTLKDHPLTAKAGDRVRIYFANMGPNRSSAFHVVGTIFSDVYVNGTPENHMKDLQTVLVPAGGSAVVEFTVKEPGRYTILDHSLADAEKGAMAYLDVKK